MAKTDKVQGLDSSAALQAPDLGSQVKFEVQQQLQGVLAQLHKKLEEDKTGLAKLAAAYIAARKACRMAVKNATNPHLKNTYADLGSVLEAVTEPFLDNDLWLQQSPGEIVVKSDGRPYQQVHGLLLHASGQSISYKMELPAYTTSKNGDMVLNPQTAGSAISYARRYMWAAVAGIIQVDDDADAASYIDTSQGPSVQLDSSSAVRNTNSTPSSDEVDQLKSELSAVKTAAELKALRPRAQDLANKYPKAGIFDLYMEIYNRFNAEKAA